MPKGSGAMWNLSPPTPGSFSSAWKSPTWTTLTVLRRPSPSGRRIPRATRARRSPPPPSATISCACCSLARVEPTAPNAAPKCNGTRWTMWPNGCSTPRPDRAGMRCSRSRWEPGTSLTRRRCGTGCSICGRRDSRGCFRKAACSNFRLPNRCSRSISQSRCSCWQTAL